MSDIKYLSRMFRNYYFEKKANIPLVESFERREFGFIPWGKKTFMMRHMSFSSRENLITFLKDNGPRHVYSSGALYQTPENQDISSKGYDGCDFIIDIDVDHFYTPCKEDHDYWSCLECGKRGSGMVKICPNCKKSKLKSITWICEDCLDIAKKEIHKLIYNFLIPDFGISLNQMKIAFSGHRGFHLKIENEKLRELGSDIRREIADYFSGENISFDILGLRAKGESIYGFSRSTIGWTQKIFVRLVEILNKPETEIKSLLLNKYKYHFRDSLVNSFLTFKSEFQEVLNNPNRNIWAIEGFGINSWISLITGIVHEIGVEIDTPVSVDIHRLIRYPGSLHGKTGFKVQELLPDEIDNFEPLDERDERLDPIVFESRVKTTQKLEILEEQVPATKIKGEKFGPYSKGEIIEVPHHIAIFLLCKEVAKTI